MQQLSSLTLSLKPTTPLDRSQRSNSLGPYLQGVLMERVEKSYAATLHQLPFNPYSQYCRWEGDLLVWRVNTLTSEAASCVIDPLRGLESLQMKAIRTEFEVVKSSQDTISLKSLLDMINEPGAAKVRVQFLTPTAFKSQGNYVILPSVRLVLQNLLMHYGQVYQNDKEGYSETIEYIDKQVRITSYSLRSEYFGQIAEHGKKIPAFVGSVTLGLRGTEISTGLVRMLLKFGEYAGVGIKTSMGMGGFRLL